MPLRLKFFRRLTLGKRLRLLTAGVRKHLLEDRGVDRELDLGLLLLLVLLLSRREEVGIIVLIGHIGLPATTAFSEGFKATSLVTALFVS